MTRWSRAKSGMCSSQFCQQPDSPWMISDDRGPSPMSTMFIQRSCDAHPAQVLLPVDVHPLRAADGPVGLGLLRASVATAPSLPGALHAQRAREARDQHRQLLRGDSRSLETNSSPPRATRRSQKRGSGLEQRASVAQLQAPVAAPRRRRAARRASRRRSPRRSLAIALRARARARSRSCSSGAPQPLLVRGADDLREDRAPEAGAERGDAPPRGGGQQRQQHEQLGPQAALRGGVDDRRQHRPRLDRLQRRRSARGCPRSSRA